MLGVEVEVRGVTNGVLGQLRRCVCVSVCATTDEKSMGGKVWQEVVFMHQ